MSKNKKSIIRSTIAGVVLSILDLTSPRIAQPRPNDYACELVADAVTSRINTNPELFKFRNNTAVPLLNRGCVRHLEKILAEKFEGRYELVWDSYDGVYVLREIEYH